MCQIFSSHITPSDSLSNMIKSFVLYSLKTSKDGLQQSEINRGFPTRMVYLYNDNNYVVEIHHSGREPSI